MESSTIHSFSTHVPFKQPVVITHYISMAIAFLGCYPLLLTRQIRRQKVYIASASLFFASIGFISGYFIQQIETNTASFVLHIFAILLLFLVIIQSILATSRSKYISENFPSFHSILPIVFCKIPKWVDLALGWIILIIAFSYLTLAALVFTESCSADQEQSQCLMPMAMGTGFILYGSVTLLHLLSIIKLPRPSTPEYYEGVILTFWGFISLLLASTPILGSEWRAINLGLLWFTGGVFSISLSVQTWIPALREKNIVNSLIICFTGRAIMSGITQVDDTYAAQVHTMLGYILMIGAVARLTQIVFRKSPADNLPLRMFQHETTGEEEEDDDIMVKDNRQPKCRHKLLFATITLVTGLLTSLLSICGGILFMGANVGWIRYMKFYIEDPSTYVNMTLAVAFLWSAYVFGICTIYKNIKANNAIHQYEYLELDNTTIDLPHHHFEPETRDWTPTTVSAMMMPMTSPPQPSDYIISTSPTNLSPLPSQLPFSPPPPKENTTNTILVEKTIRPSEYRAKRRSLLIQSPTPLYSTNISRGRSSSNLGVGGVLPDEIIQLQNINTPMDSSTNRRSWLSSAGSNHSGGGYYSGSIDSSSSAPNSPSFDQKLINQQEQQQAGSLYMDQARRNSISFDEYYNEGKERRRSVRKTESGKRKARRLMNQYYNSDQTNLHGNHGNMAMSNSSGSKFQRWSHPELLNNTSNLTKE